MSDNLLPCPFCGGSQVHIEPGGQTWRGTGGYSNPQFYHLRHWGQLSGTDPFPTCSVDIRHRTKEDAISAWNTRSGAPLDAMQHAADAIRANRPGDALAFLAPWVKPGEVG